MRNKTLIHAAAASLVLMAGTATRGDTYSNAVIALNPVAYWPLTETVAPPSLYVATNSGTLGAAGNGYYETWYQTFGGTTLQPTNVIQHVAGVTVDGDTALQNSLVGQHVVIPRVLNGVSNAAVTITPPFSIEVWVYPTNAAASGGIKPLVGEGFVNTLNGPSLGNQTVSQGVTIGSYNNLVYFSTFNGAGTKSEIDTAAYAANTWHHIVGTFDGTTMKLYDNGLLRGSVTPPLDPLGRRFAPDLVTPLLIGSGGNQNNPFGGVIDEVAIYTNVLAATDVTNHFQAAYGTNATYGANYRNAVLAKNPTIYLRLDEPAYSGAPSLSSCPVANNYGSLGSAANGYYQPGTTPGVSGPGYAGFSGATAVALDGFNAGVDIGLGSVPALLNPTGNQPLTVMTWFRGNPSDAVGRFQEILGHSDLGWRLGYDFNAGNRFNPGAGPELLFGSVAEEIQKGFFLNDGNWHFVAGVSDGTNDYLYLDGLLAKSGTAVASMVGTNLDVVLGGDPQYTAPTLGASGSRYFDGSIAQVAFFTNALTGTQIQQLYSAAGVPPQVRVQPLSQATFSGQVITLNPTVSGSATLTYHWYKDGSVLTGKTDASLSFNPIGTGDVGSYYVAVTNSYGWATSTVAVLSVKTSPNAYASAVSGLNPVGYWPLDETVQPPFGSYIATNLGTAGASANGYYQTYFVKSSVGTAPYYQANNIAHVAGAITGGDTALSCTRSAAGAGQYVVFPRSNNGVANSALTLTPPFSIEFWVNPAGTTSAVMPIVNEGRVNVLDPRNGYTTVNEDGFCVGQYGGNLFFSTWNGTGGDSTKQELDTAITAGTWQHMVITFDGVSQTWYKNGTQVAHKNINPTPNAFGELYMVDLTSPLLIGTGSELSAGNSGTEYSGSIDEVAIYTNLLDAGSIATHYTAASSSDSDYVNAVLSSSPIVYVRLDEPAFNSYPSASTYPVAANYGSAGAAANGVYQPGTVPGLPGPSFTGFGGSHVVAINGYSGGVDVGGGYVPLALNPTGNQPLSLTAWFQANPADAPARFQAIVSHGNSGPRLTVDSVAAGPRWNPGNNPEVQFVSPSDVLTNNALVNDGAWHFIAGVSDGSSATLYLDGVAVRTNTGVGSLASSTGDFLLGGDPDNITPNYNTANTIRYFDGQIAQVAFFTNALTGAQIQQLYSAAGVPPTITIQPPASVDAFSGQLVSIPITAQGSPTLAYQWYRSGGAAVAGQTSSALTFNPVALANAGSYYAVVTNSAGHATSSVVALSVTGPPFVTQQSPTDVRVFVGTTPSLRVAAAGPQPISYQWTRDGTPIGGANASSYVPSTAATGAHTYSCQVTNIYSTNVPSAFSPITVSVLSPPTAPYPVAVLNDHAVDYFRLDEPDDASGNNGLPAYDYAGGLNASYTNTINAQPGYDALFSPQTDPTETSANFGQFAFTDSYAGNVSSFLNFGTSNGYSAAFSVEAWVNGPYAQTAGAGIVSLGYGYGGEQFALDTGSGTGNNFRFFVHNAAGGPAFVVNGTNAPNDGLWHHVVGVCDEPNGQLYLYVDGQLTASGTITTNSGILSSANSLSIGSRQSHINTDFDSQFAGNIDDVAIYNYALTPDQVLAHYTSAGVPPLIVVQPRDLTTNEGTTATMSVSAVGTAALSYLWYDNNGQAIPDGTSPTLGLTNVQQSQSGYYHVNVAGPYTYANNPGPVQSAPALLTVNSGPPVLTADLQPPFFIGYANRPFSYTVGVSGTAPFTYTWTRNGSVITEATNSTYTFTALVGTNLYAVHITNAQNPAGIDSVTVTNVGVAAPALDPLAYHNKVQITFVGYNRGETLANFPALVRFGANISGFDYSQMASPTGGDLRFTDDTGLNEIPYEIDEWNPSGISSVWVQVPKLAGPTNSIWAYWGNPAATMPADWSTNGAVWVPLGGVAPYEVVYHLKEGALPFEDSTQQRPALAGVAPGTGTGMVGTGAAFTGGQYLDAGFTDVGDVFTLSAWANVPTGTADQQTIWANQHGGYGLAGFAMFENTYQHSDQLIDFASGDGAGGGNESTTPTGSVPAGQWHLLTAAINRTNGAALFYVDGIVAGSSSAIVKDFPTYADLNLGQLTNGGAYFHGTMDEARIQQGNSSPNWVWADYMTVAQNAAFENYGSAGNPAVTINAEVISGKLVLSWPSGTLLQAPTVAGPWTTNNVSSPYTNNLSSPQEYYRVIVH